MNVKPHDYCEHGVVSAWEVTDARPGDPMPVIEGCDQCGLVRTKTFPATASDCLLLGYYKELSPMTDPLNVEVWHDAPQPEGQSWVEYEVTGSSDGYPPYVWAPSTRSWAQKDIDDNIAQLRGRLDNMVVRRRTVVAFEWEVVE